MMKICSRCYAEKNDSEFGRWLVCKRCLADRQKERTKEIRKTPEGRANHNKWANEFHKRHRSECIEKMAMRRNTLEYKQRMKAYREVKKDKIYKQEVITKKRYHDKHRDSISDRYLVNLLRTQGFGKTEDLIKNKELLETYRIHIQLKRLIYATNNSN